MNSRQAWLIVVLFCVTLLSFGLSGCGAIAPDCAPFASVYDAPGCVAYRERLARWGNRDVQR